MMTFTKHLIFLFFFALLIGAACDRSASEEADEAAAAEEELQAEEDDGKESAELHQFLGETMVARPFGILNRFVEMGCECDFEGMGFEDTDSCIEERSMVDAKFAEAGRCAAESAAESEEPAPEATVETLECLASLVDEVEECLDEAATAHDDPCTVEAEEAFASCYGNLHRILQQGYQMCTGDEPEPEVITWLEGVGRHINANDCFGVLRELQATP